MPSASPYVIVTNVEESVEYYKEVFGGTIKVLNKHQEKVLHAELYLGQSLIHFSDAYGAEPNNEHVKIIIQLDEELEARRIYDTLRKEGQVVVELQDTFFGALHGQVKDSMNHITWVLNYFKHQA